ncbi:MAG: hypothetical protein Kow0059_05110 [Candidatus Sumerlaeia bacterium]
MRIEGEGATSKSGERALPAPIVTLPVGVTTSRRPLVAWRAAGMQWDACRIRVTRDDAPNSATVFDSGEASSSGSGYQIPADLPAGETLFVWVRLRVGGRWSGWSVRRAPFRIEPLPQPTGMLAVFDLHYTRHLPPRAAFEHAHLVAVLQGLVNREGPRLYVDFVEAQDEPEKMDALWLERMRQPGAWLERMTLEPVADIVSLVERFRADVKGVVVWDPQVPATSNVASTVAGVEGLLPVCRNDAPDSLYNRLVAGGPRLPVVRDLTGLFTRGAPIAGTRRPSTGSAKGDAYAWALEHYLKTGRCDPRFLAYYMDAWWIRDPRPGRNLQNHTLTNHDYFVTHRAFFFDLSPWGDERPIDDPDQPLGLDRALFEEILRTAWEAVGGREMIMMGGFTPWAFKYTDWRTGDGAQAGGRHGGVETEWEHVKLCSAFNVYLDADALHLSALANASLTRHHPLPERYAQMLPPMPEELERRGLLDGQGRPAPKNYVMHYVGDYDAAAWTMNALPLFWRRPERGRLPMCWAVNPNLAERARPMFWWFFQTRSGNDHLIAGDSGAGYINPTQLLEPRAYSNLPSAADAWRRHCTGWYQRFDINFTGFLIQGLSGTITPEAERLYLPFSINGVVVQYERWWAPLHLQDRMPCFVLEADLGRGVEADARAVLKRAKAGEVNFIVFRSVLQPPSYYVQLNEEIVRLRPDLEFVFCSADEMAYLARAHLGAGNNRLTTFLWTGAPAEAEAGTTIPLEIVVRNDGWNVWKAEGVGAAQLAAEVTADGEFHDPVMADLPYDVAPGDCAVVGLKLPLPATPGPSILRAEMFCPCVKPGWFSCTGEAPLLQPISITPRPAER